MNRNSSWLPVASSGANPSSSITTNELRSRVSMVRPTVLSAMPENSCSTSSAAVRKRTSRSWWIAAWPSAMSRCDLPVPGGPTTTTFSAASIHSSDVR